MVKIIKITHSLVTDPLYKFIKRYLLFYYYIFYIYKFILVKLDVPNIKE